MRSQHTSRPVGYDVVRRSAGWVDKRARGRLRFEGADRAAFLHALISNDIESLRAGQGTYATYLTPQGRLIADMRVYCASDHLLVDVPPGLADTLLERFDQVIFTERVTIQNVSQSLAQIAIVGPEAASTLGRVCAIDSRRIEELPLFSHVDDGTVMVARTDDTALPSFDVFAAANQSDELLRNLSRLEIDEVPDAVAEALRIEAGRPQFGIDMTEETIPLEAGLLDRAISQTKGCYVGQEVIIRVLHRGGGRVAKRLVQLELDPSVKTLPAAGTTISADEKDLGRVTSAAWSDARQRVVALGYVHRDIAEIGRRVSVDGRPADIVGFAG